MTIKDVKIGFQSRLTNIYSLKEIESICYIFLEYIGYKKHDLIINASALLSESNIQTYSLFLERLLKHEPIQYISEEAFFYGNTFYVNSNVLIPRQETELLVDIIIKNHAASTNLTIIDMCTGSGCIAISLKHAIEQANVHAADISEAALHVAKKNAKNLNAAIDFYSFNLLEKEQYTKLPSCSVLVSNPPYVRQCDKEKMQKNVLDFEPELALFVPDENPLVFFDALALLGQTVLQNNGHVYCEINERLGNETKQVFENAGYSSVSVIKDLHNKNRFIHAIK